MAHYDSLFPPQRQQDTTCSRTCQSPSKGWLEWAVTRQTTWALLQILLHPAAKSMLSSKHSPSPSLLSYPNSLKKEKKKAYNDVARKDFICSTSSQSFLYFLIFQTILCTWLSPGCEGEGCHGDELWQEAGGYSLKGQTSMHFHGNDRLHILSACNFHTPMQLPVYKPPWMQNYACKRLCWSNIAAELPNP